MSHEILDELAQAEMADGLYERPNEVCETCGATRWEHNDEQWSYCQLSDEQRALYNMGIQGREQ